LFGRKAFDDSIFDLPKGHDGNADDADLADLRGFYPASGVMSENSYEGKKPRRTLLLQVGWCLRGQ
jgi:hypothetical protein